MADPTLDYVITVRRDPDRALEIARYANHVPLYDAARITLLLAEKWHPRYHAAAKRLLVRVIKEVPDAPLEQIKKLADVLAFVHDGYWGEQAMLGLEHVVRQLHAPEVRLRPAFDSSGRKRPHD